MSESIVKKDKNEILSDNVFVIEEEVTRIEEEEVVYDIKDMNEFLSAPKGSLKYTFNIIKYPIFSKNKQIKEFVSKKYVFDKKNDRYIRIIPSNNESDICNKILQDFDENIFMALSRLFEIQQEKNPANFILTDYYTIIKIAGIKYNGKTLMRTKDSIQRLSGCAIEYNNIYYDSFAKSIGNDYKNTSVKMRIISKIKEYELKNAHKIEDEEIKKMLLDYFAGRKIKEILQIYLDEELLNSYKTKGYKYYKYEDLYKLSNDSIARKIYLNIVHWSYFVKGNTMIRLTKTLASIIPLSINPKSLSKTIGIIKRALGVLQEYDLITEFELIKCGSSLIESKFEIKFKKDKLYSINKQIDFKDEEEVILENEKEENINVKKKENNYSEEEYLEKGERLFDFVRESNKTLDVKEWIIQQLKEYDFYKIRDCICYSNDRADKNKYKGYVFKALESNYADGYYNAIYLLKREEKEKKKERIDIEEIEKDKELELIEKIEKEELVYTIKDLIENKFNEEEFYKLDRLCEESLLKAAPLKRKYKEWKNNGYLFDKSNPEIVIKGLIMNIVAENWILKKE